MFLKYLELKRELSDYLNFLFLSEVFAFDIENSGRWTHIIVIRV